jgi:TonB family protein
MPHRRPGSRRALALVAALPALLVLGIAQPTAAQTTYQSRGQPDPVPPQAARPTPPPVVPPSPLTPLHADYPEGGNGDATVVLVIVVNATGSVRTASVASGDEPFASAAIAASSGWRFTPATREGKPIAASIKAQIAFTAPPPPEPPAATPSDTAPAAPAKPPEPPKPKALEVTVKGEQPAPGVQSFTRAEVRLLPGAFGDPFRAIDALPGVTPLVSGLPFFYVRGAPPGNVGYFLDGIRVPLLYHVGLGPSVVNPAIMDRVDLYSGGYPASYGRYSGGIVAGETREPDPVWHAEGNLRIFDAGAMVQGPLPDDLGSFIVGGRYSYTAALLTAISSQIDLAYWDYQARVSFKVTPKDTLTIFAFGAHDFLGTKDNGDVSTLFDTTFHRLDLRYDHRFGGPEDRVRAAVTFGLDNTTFDPTTYVDDYLIAARTEVVKRVNDAVLVRAGLDTQLDAYKSTLLGSSVFSGDSGFTAAFPDHTETTVGLHADAVIAISPRIEVTPGVRIDFFGSHRWSGGGASYSAVAVDPRLAARFVVNKDVRIVTTNGIASQPPSFILPGPGFALDLQGGLQRSFQTSVGVEADLPWDVSAVVTVFHDEFFNLTDALGDVSLGNPSSLSSFNQRVDGDSYGLEVMLRRRLTRRLGGLISYTLSRSERFISGGVVPSAFDRTHIFNVAGSYDFGHGIKGGSRMMFYTGFPVDNTNPQAGRAPPFFRFDARLEKRWSIVNGRGWLSLVLEGLNVFGAKETVSESPTCATPNPPMGVCTKFTGGYTPTVIGPVTVPSIGLEGGF